ncbi:MAG: ABC transporter substrate-binding protein [Planctomycetota bacterium]|jgi:ABC-type glycerol-3-phosphate transport system substrate-binding protein
MTIRGTMLFVLLGLPALVLLAFGPRRALDVPAERTVIRYWEKWSGIEGRAMQRIVDRFNETVGAEQGIWVEYCAISNVDQRTLIATAGGDPPDVAGLFDHVVPQFADQGALLELDDLVREFGIDPAVFKPTWWQIGVYNDLLYALPSTPFTVALHYNKRLFREAGLDPERPPQTIAELDEYSRRLTVRDERGSIVQAGFMPAPALLGWWHWAWPCFFDARLWDGHRFTLDTPEVHAAMKWIATRRAELGFKDALEFEAIAGAIEGSQNPFIAERLAMVFQGPWVANWVRAFNPAMEYGVAAFPSVSTQRRNVLVSADVFAIPRGSSHPREAMEFLSYVLRQEVMEELCRLHGKVSPFREPGPGFYENHPNPHIRVFDELALADSSFGHPKMPTFRQASTEMLFMLENVLQGVRGPEEAVGRTQSKIDSLVTEYQRMSAKRRRNDGKAGR